MDLVDDYLSYLYLVLEAGGQWEEEVADGFLKFLFGLGEDMGGGCQDSY